MGVEQGAEEDYVVSLEEIGRGQIALVGGKGAQLGELSRVEGIAVPPGFCITTHAFRRAVSGSAAFEELLEGLSSLGADDPDAICECSARLRRAVEEAGVPEEVATAVRRALGSQGERVPSAVRSSATAEDLPSASFAGQHETYLNIVGPDAVLAHLVLCWASLFTERAVAYRLRTGLDHRAVEMAVVVQRMVPAEAAGVLFTADPTTSSRGVAVIEASLGPGEALVSGLVSPDRYTVREGRVTGKEIAAKRLALEPSASGGAREAELDAARVERPALTDEQVVELAGLGRVIEAALGTPQDIEWCLADGAFAIVQSRPITRLFPIPVRDGDDPHVYVSVGHQQMMTDAMKPLGLSLFQSTALRPMYEAGGRLFVDVAKDLAAVTTREAIVGALGRSDPLIGDALESVLRSGFVPDAPTDGGPSGAPARAPQEPLEADPAIVAQLIAGSEAALEAVEREIRARTGVELLDFILADIPALQRLISDPVSSRAIMTLMDAAAWLDEHLGEWLGETNAADKLSLSVPGNVTSEMGLDLLDLADTIRPHSEVVGALERADGEELFDVLEEVTGGSEAREAITAYLERYGMRCAGEIDITRPRWSERPSTLVPMILSNVRSFEPGAARRRFERGRQEAAATEEEVLTRLRATRDGDRKAGEAKLAIDRLRTFAGYREYPKYAIVGRYSVYKEALLAEADRLVGSGVIAEREDIYHLTLPELREVVRTGELDQRLIAERKRELRLNQTLSPPRVLTSDGEVFAGSYRRGELPPGALAGLAVCGGAVEGRARVVLDIAQAELEPGDVLVTAYTDPSWSPLFPVLAGLVTEVGGLMTHGAVIAREYGLPTVVGVESATRLIADGRRIRVHGSDGYVEILD
jgi:rifampicin phosphotransferase